MPPRGKYVFTWYTRCVVNTFNHWFSKHSYLISYRQVQFLMKRVVKVGEKELIGCVLTFRRVNDAEGSVCWMHVADLLSLKLTLLTFLLLKCVRKKQWAISRYWYGIACLRFICLSTDQTNRVFLYLFNVSCSAFSAKGTKNVSVNPGHDFIVAEKLEEFMFCWLSL